MEQALESRFEIAVTISWTGPVHIPRKVRKKQGEMSVVSQNTGWVKL
jgi:hypothetical protein